MMSNISFLRLVAFHLPLQQSVCSDLSPILSHDCLPAVGSESSSYVVDTGPSSTVPSANSQSGSLPSLSSQQLPQAKDLNSDEGRFISLSFMEMLLASYLFLLLFPSRTFTALLFTSRSITHCRLIFGQSCDVQVEYYFHPCPTVPTPFWWKEKALLHGMSLTPFWKINQTHFSGSLSEFCILVHWSTYAHSFANPIVCWQFYFLLRNLKTGWYNSSNFILGFQIILALLGLLTFQLKF